MDVFSHIRQVADMRFAQATQDLLEHAREWRQVEGWLEDEESRSAYCDELSFWGVRRLFGEDPAIKYSGTVSQEAWNQAVQQVDTARAAGNIPLIESGLEENNPHVLYGLAAGFIFNQYAYKDVVDIRQGDVVVDCGACFGETALWARMRGAARVWSFEPNPDTFVWLEKNAARYNNPEHPWLFPVPMAVGNKEESLPFKQIPDHPGGCGFSGDGNIQVPVTTLDAWCEKNKVKPDFIKMDLEGAEGMALLGAEHILRTYKPRVAICLYHRLDDMWLLPRLLKTWVPEYRFWCKKSSLIGEFVLFGSV